MLGAKYAVLKIIMSPMSRKERQRDCLKLHWKETRAHENVYLNQKQSCERHAVTELINIRLFRCVTHQNLFALPNRRN